MSRARLIAAAAALAATLAGCGSDNRSAEIACARGCERRAPLEACEIEHVADHSTEPVRLCTHRSRVARPVLGISQVLRQHLGVQHQAREGGLELVGGGGGESRPLSGQAIRLKENQDDRAC